MPLESAEGETKLCGQTRMKQITKLYYDEEEIPGNLFKVFNVIIIIVIEILWHMLTAKAQVSPSIHAVFVA